MITDGGLTGNSIEKVLKKYQEKKILLIPISITDNISEFSKNFSKVLPDGFEIKPIVSEDDLVSYLKDLFLNIGKQNKENSF